MLDDTFICQAKATSYQLFLRSLVGFFEGLAVCGAGVNSGVVAAYVCRYLLLEIFTTIILIETFNMNI